MSIMRGPVDIQCDECLTWLGGYHGESAAEVRKGLRRAGWKTGLPGGKDLCKKCVVVAAITKPYEQVIRPRTPLGACPECGSEILGFKNDHEGNVTRLCGCRAD